MELNFSSPSNVFPVNQSAVELIPSIWMGIEPFNPFASVDKFLIESFDKSPTDTPDLCSKKASILRQTLRTGCRSPNEPPADNDEICKHKETEAAGKLTSLKQAEKNQVDEKSFLNVESFVQIKLTEQHTSPFEKNRAPEDNSYSDFNRMSTKRKGKKEAHRFESNDCKRCRCKKSMCLKLYCECFAAGEYCDGLCSCKECFNRFDYEDTVLESREQIESRYPLAFAPKIVQCAAESSQNIGQNGNQTTPASARHIKGCSCKKSKCLQKYCECFQSGVGCSIGCRCEGCLNVCGIE